MMEFKRFCFLSFFCLFSLFSSIPVSAKRVLLINSYSPDFPTYVNVEKAVLEQNENLDVDIEFLYGKELDDSIYFEHLKVLIAHKITMRPAYDVVVTVDNIALKFALDSREDIFQDLPLVFCGVEDDELIRRARNTKGVSGITEFVAFDETIELAKSMNPRLEEVVVLVDNTITGVANYELFKSYCQKNNNLKYSSINYGQTTFEGVIRQIEKLSGNKAILLISAYRDSTNTYLPFYRVLEELVNVSQLPIYHLYEHGMGRGVVGGELVSHFNMVEAILQKLNRLSAAELYRDTTITNVVPLGCVVDYEMVVAMGLDESAIPDDAIVINKPSSTFSIDKTVVYFIFLTVCLLLLFIVYLSVTVKNRRVMTHELMIAKDKAEEANRLKTAFITNMSHEIRTPMNSIVGFSSLLRSTDLNYETRGQYCQIIEENSNHLLSLICDIIDVSKIESGDFSLRLSKIEVIPLFQNLCVEYQQKIRRLDKNIKLDMKADIPDGMIIVSDKVRIKQLVSNLLGNAVKYTQEGSIVLGCFVSDNELFVYVKDTGIGISQNNISRVFDRFTREEDAKKVYDGTGLGLAISKSIVQQFDGEIWVESKKGVGSTFYFTHPIS